MKLPLVGLLLLGKSVVEVRGKDATKFLNGLVTSRFLPSIEKKKQYTISDADNANSGLNDVVDIEKNWGLMHEDIYDPENTICIGRDGINSMFLNSKGRIITDCFIYSNPFSGPSIDIEPSYLIEIDSSMKSQLMMLLKLHKLSSKIKINLVNYNSYYYYNDSVQFDQFLDYLQLKFFRTSTPTMAMESSNQFMNQNIIFNHNLKNTVLGFAVDNRIPNFGIKFITNKPLDNESVFSSEFPFESTVVPEENIIQRRYTNGLFEMQDAPKNMALLPFDTNLDYINGLSLEKGCYMGQELTIRTYNNGIIRKRIVPIQFFDVEDLSKIQQSELIEFDNQDPIIEDLKYITSFDTVSISPLFEQDAPDAEPLAPQKLQSPFAKSQETTPFPQSPTSPFVGSSSPFAGSLKPVRRRKTSPGKIVSIKDNLGFLLVSLSDVKHNKYYKVDVTLPDGTTKPIGIKVNIPDWWPQEEDD